ncbi:unnamed protein product [Debaryomyces tyrocola]|nr:unnamed protein product [Debaryomyces tyrocola]
MWGELHVNKQEMRRNNSAYVSIRDYEYSWVHDTEAGLKSNKGLLSNKGLIEKGDILTVQPVINGKDSRDTQLQIEYGIYPTMADFKEMSSGSPSSHLFNPSDDPTQFSEMFRKMIHRCKIIPLPPKVFNSFGGYPAHRRKGNEFFGH